MGTDDLSGFEAPEWDSLTSQERRILELVAKGLTNRQVAEELFLAEATVRKYLASIRTKLSRGPDDDGPDEGGVREPLRPAPTSDSGVARASNSVLVPSADAASGQVDGERRQDAAEVRIQKKDVLRA